MQRIGMAWPRGEDLPIERLGLRQLAGLMMRERQFKRLLNSYLGDEFG
jgi:hypothetical protein